MSNEANEDTAYCPKAPHNYPEAGASCIYCNAARGAQPAAKQEDAPAAEQAQWATETATRIKEWETNHGRPADIADMHAIILRCAAPSPAQEKLVAASVEELVRKSAAGLVMELVGAPSLQCHAYVTRVINQCIAAAMSSASPAPKEEAK